MLKAQSELVEAQSKRLVWISLRSSAIMISGAEAQLALADEMLKEARSRWDIVESWPL
jgi:hypothetical protein